MSILIKGMEMPKNCFLCPLSYMRNERLFCFVTKEEVLRAKIATECPIVPVPEHGRLIDADALTLRVDMHGTNKFGMLDDDIREFINAAPTIIPADKEGEG